MSAAIRSALTFAVIFIAACLPAPSAPPAVTLLVVPLPTAKAVLEGRTARVEIAVEIAETDEVRLRGLMFREGLDPDRGMIFLFSTDTSVAFHMRNVRFPLSIAFADPEGRILRILDMEPCAADPCPSYDPAVTYRSALEVQRGAFARWGIAVGDRIRLLRSPQGAVAGRSRSREAAV